LRTFRAILRQDVGLQNTLIQFDEEFAAQRLVPVVVIAPPSQTAYLPESGAVPRSLTVRSEREPEGVCREPIFGPGNRDVVPAQPVADLSSLFRPPFRLATGSALCGDCDQSGGVTANEITRVIANIFAPAASTATGAMP
jgi:hypothetical protein